MTTLRITINGHSDDFELEPLLDQMERNKWKISPMLTYQKNELEIKLELRK